ncbi:hypothetical protein [Rheinheimera sp. WS51]|uniref:hypothetical protein n=1 Tax=Rheinheimera sp. WS51 TaxID=3425886 RepID=UPI003D909E2A
MKYLLLFLLLWPFCTHAIEWEDEDCGSWNAYQGKVFSLEVGTSFHGQVTFKLCKSKEQSTLAVKVHRIQFDEKSEKSTETIVREHIKLSNQKYDEIYSRYEQALKYNALDEISGLDGSNWCLESQRGFTYTKGCFWTPSHEPKERGLEDLYNLGVYLWSVSGLEKDKTLKLY